MDLIVIFVVFVGALFLALYALNSFFSQEEGKFLSRVTRIAPKLPVAKPEEWAKMDAQTREDWVRQEAMKETSDSKDLRELIAKFAGINLVEKTEQLLLQADLKMRVSEFMILRFFLLVGPAAVVFLLTKNIAYAGAVAAIGFFAPGMYLKKMTKGRMVRFNSQLADFLVLVVNALRAGQTFMQGLSHASKDSVDPIRTEFHTLLKESNFGMPVEDAMKNVLKRVPSADMEIVCIAFMIQKSVGGNLAEVLDKVAGTIRERVRLQGQISVLTTQGVFSGTVVGLMPFFVGGMIFLINREYIMVLFTTFAGKCCLAAAFTMWAIGFIAIKKIVTIEI